MCIEWGGLRDLMTPGSPFLIHHHSPVREPLRRCCAHTWLVLRPSSLSSHCPIVSLSGRLSNSVASWSCRRAWRTRSIGMFRS